LDNAHEEKHPVYKEAMPPYIQVKIYVAWYIMYSGDGICLGGGVGEGMIERNR
jgi:hypothetical protein